MREAILVATTLPPLGRWTNAILAGSALVVLSPLLSLLALAVWLDDGGPVLFHQERVGRDRRSFQVVKLRTMRDGRVTRVGRWLRASALDELPQLINVLRGDMAVVGPRPLTPEDIRRLGWGGADFDHRFSAAPGMTGLAQVYAGGGVRTSRRLDRIYLRRSSLGLDIGLIAAAVAINVLGKRRARTMLRRLRRRRTL